MKFKDEKLSRLMELIDEILSKPTQFIDDKLILLVVFIENIKQTNGA